ncbi:uncharacterized protein LOC110006782 [Amborella trichopoda]|uniref:uncharacterized protein LOC110006782 n=1 Tax=Amborella trichopoda TaxID=13333 RepID=UPI0009C0D3D7|nr:uncharacterized protein LOC110006782 [Amborella trichopoda]|eukprot:XP_020519549.1 uncharacterized protein LOC110006782 [Amborella trichopoda]
MIRIQVIFKGDMLVGFGQISSCSIVSRIVWFCCSTSWDSVMAIGAAFCGTAMLWEEIDPKNYYVVFKVEQPGVYDSWANCEHQVKYFKNLEFKDFGTREEAEAAYNLCNMPQRLSTCGCINQQHFHGYDMDQFGPSTNAVIKHDNYNMCTIFAFSILPIIVFFSFLDLR